MCIYWCIISFNSVKTLKTLRNWQTNNWIKTLLLSFILVCSAFYHLEWFHAIRSITMTGLANGFSLFIRVGQLFSDGWEEADSWWYNCTSTGEITQANTSQISFKKIILLNPFIPRSFSHGSRRLPLVWLERVDSSVRVHVRMSRLLPSTLIVICIFHGQSDVSDPNTGLAGAQPVIRVSGLKQPKINIVFHGRRGRGEGGGGHRGKVRYREPGRPALAGGAGRRQRMIN